MSKITDKVKDTGKVIADSAKDAAHFLADKAGQAADWVKDKTRPECGPAKGVANIEPKMDVLSSCGCNMGKVDHVEAGSIKLTKQDSTDGMHHFVPCEWVARVDEHVHLSRNAEELTRLWHEQVARTTAV